MKKILNALIKLFSIRLEFSLGVFASAYFLYAFSAYVLNVAEFDLIGNGILFICLLIVFETHALELIWKILCALGALVLFYKDNYYPNPSQIKDAFLASHQGYIEFASDLIADCFDAKVLALMALCLVATYFLSAAIRLASCVVIAFIILGIFNIHSSLNAISDSPMLAQNIEDESPDLPPTPQGRSTDEIDSYWQTFLELEAQRKVDFVTTLPTDFAPFDVVILNICSLAVDDLKATSLLGHELFKHFDYVFDDFNSASSYSTPASLRLLRMNCGQLTEAKLYAGRRSECEIMTSLEGLGYETNTIFDHDGVYGNYLKTLHELAGLNDRLYTGKSWSNSYKGFDGSLLYADGDLFDSYVQHVAFGVNTPQATFMNLLSLHDGNRFPNENHAATYEVRLATLLNDINEYVRALSDCKRKTLLIMVPEHGAAIRGDKMQIAKLREIPTDTITRVPVLVKFLGAPFEKKERQQITGHYSYLALAEIINRAIALNVFSDTSAQGTIDDVMVDLPQTAAVSEATNAHYVVLPEQGFYMLKGGEWAPYKK